MYTRGYITHVCTLCTCVTYMNYLLHIYMYGNIILLLYTTTTYVYFWTSRFVLICIQHDRSVYNTWPSTRTSVGVRVRVRKGARNPSKTIFNETPSACAADDFLNKQYKARICPADLCDFEKIVLHLILSSQLSHDLFLRQKNLYVLTCQFFFTDDVRF